MLDATVSDVMNTEDLYNFKKQFVWVVASCHPNVTGITTHPACRLLAWCHAFEPVMQRTEVS